MFWSGIKSGDIMRCVKCGISRKKTNQKCWKKHQMCGGCAIIYHPEDYDKAQIGRLNGYSNARDNNKTSVIPRMLCPGCENTVPKLYTHTKSTSIRIPVWYCNKCKSIMVDSSIKIIPLVVKEN